MILPTKGIPPSKALVTVGGDVLEVLGASALTTSALWMRTVESRSARSRPRISFDWFVLALDFLFAIKAIDLTAYGLIKRAGR